MKLIITERQYRLLIENEEESDSDLFEMDRSVVPDYLWDKTFMRANKSGKYRGYYINGDVTPVPILKFKFDYLVEVRGNVNLYMDMYLESLPLLERVEGDLNFQRSNVTNMDNLKFVGGNMEVNQVIESLPSLEEVKKKLNLSDSSVKELPKLKTVGELRIDGTNIESLPSLETVTLFLKATVSDLRELPALKNVGNEKNGYGCHLNHTKITELPVGLEVYGTLDIRYTPLAKKIQERGMTGSEVSDMFNVYEGSIEYK
jgi:hypothetical protein